jgi:16S rRNA (uracil1498-N3)-methyltransferase
MNRFFLLDAPLSVDQIVDLAPLVHQLYTVLRLRVGGEIILLDGSGFEYPTRLQSIERTVATGLILAQRPVQREPAVAVTLYQAILKGDKFEWVLQKGTELGVARFVPLISERSVVRPASAILKKYPRWRTIVREAAEQSGRGRIPEILTPILWSEAIIQAQGLRLLPWEGAAGGGRIMGLGETITLRRDGTSPIIDLAIGPEGGLSPSEVEAAEDTGWHVVSLGPRILRAETAAITALSVIFDRFGVLGG